MSLNWHYYPVVSIFTNLSNNLEKNGCWQFSIQWNLHLKSCNQVASFRIHKLTHSPVGINDVFYVFVLQETNAFHIDMKRGSYIEISIPQLVGIEGYNTKIVGQASPLGCGYQSSLQILHQEWDVRGKTPTPVSFWPQGGCFTKILSRI